MINFFNIVPRLNIPINTWDEFVDSSDDAWLWHRYIFQDSACTWKGRIDLSFAVCDANKEILALVPLQKISRHGVNFLDVRQKTHIQHAICLVKDKHLYIV